MIGRLAAQVGLLAFGLAILGGLYAGNSPGTVLLRAVLASIVAVLVGQLAGWAGKLALRDHLQRKKASIDLKHLETCAPAAPHEDPPAAAPDQAG